MRLVLGLTTLALLGCTAGPAPLWADLDGLTDDGRRAVQGLQLTLAEGADRDTLGEALGEIESVAGRLALLAEGPEASPALQLYASLAAARLWDDAHRCVAGFEDGSQTAGPAWFLFGLLADKALPFSGAALQHYELALAALCVQVVPEPELGPEIVGGIERHGGGASLAALCD